MQNSNKFSLLLITPLLLLLTLTNQACPTASTSLPLFSTSVKKMQLDGFTNQLSFNVKVTKSLAAYLVVLDADGWKDLAVYFMVFNRATYAWLLVDVLEIKGQIGNSITKTKALPQSYTQTPSKIISFLTGLTISRKDQLQYSYQLSLQEQYQQKTKSIVLTIKTGPNSLVTQCSLTYLVISQPPTNSIITPFGTIFELDTILTGTNIRYWRQTPGFPQNILIGISSFQIKQGPGQFYLQIGIAKQLPSSLNITTNLIVNALRVGAFVVVGTSQSMCGMCSGKIAYSQGEQIVCGGGCNGVLDNGRCLLCPSELGYGIVKNSCACLNDQTEIGGHCVSPILAQSVKFSLSNSQCIEPNSINSPDGCICKSGYTLIEKPSGSQCIQSCPPLHYFNSKQCIQCSSGQYPNNDQMTCTQCTKNCQQCKSQFACSICQSNYKVNSIGQCQGICGDGVVIGNFSQGACDDGNTVDGDGCSSKCVVENGWSCVEGLGRVCRRIDYTVVRQSNYFPTITLYALEYKITPPLPSYIPTSQIQKTVQLKILKSQPLQTYINHNQNDLSLIKIVFDYGGMPPLRPGELEVTILLPNGNPFVEKVVQNMFGADASGKNNAKRTNSKKDKLR